MACIALPTLALLDTHVRGVGLEEAKGGRTWSNYTWHGDQAPVTHFTTGLQASDEDFNDLRNSRLHIQCGKNLVENKMAESHFFVEVMGAGPRSSRSRRNTRRLPPSPITGYLSARQRAALFLKSARWLMDNERYDADFVKRFTDFPCWCGWTR